MTWHYFTDKVIYKGNKFFENEIIRRSPERNDPRRRRDPDPDKIRKNQKDYGRIIDETRSRQGFEGPC